MIETRHVRFVRLVEKGVSQATESEYERCSQTSHNVLTIETPHHERDRFLIIEFLGGTSYRKKIKLGEKSQDNRASPTNTGWSVDDDAIDHSDSDEKIRDEYAEENSIQSLSLFLCW